MTKRPPLPPASPPDHLATSVKPDASRTPRRTRRGAGDATGTPASPAVLKPGKKIAKAGIYADVPIEAYHGDLCAGPSLSASNAIDIVTTNPRKARARSYLDRDRRDDDTTNSLIGTCVHALLLEGEEAFARIHCVKPWFPPGKNGKAMRHAWERENAGKIELARKEPELVRAMAATVQADPDIWPLIRSGAAEQTIVWQDRATGLWCKARPDILNVGRGYGLDYKTVPNDHPDSFEAHSWRMGYHMQAAWALEGLAATGHDVEGWKWHLIPQERDPPYDAAWIEMTPDLLAIGAAKNRQARAIWAACLASGTWPGYRRADQPHRAAPIPIGPPRWAGFQHEERRELPRLATDIADPEGLRLAFAAQAPLDRIGAPDHA